MLWGLGFHIQIKKEIFENLLAPNCDRWSFDIWYVASSSGPLPVCSCDAPGVKTGPALGVTIWNKGTKKENFKILL